LGKEIRSKIGLFCNVHEDSVIEVADVDTTIYEVPLLFKKSRLDEIVLKKLNLPINDLEIDKWQKFVNRIKKPVNEVKVGIIGKYAKYEDSYKSIYEAFIHAGSINNTKVNVELVNSEEISVDNMTEKLSHLQGILVGPGFGNRGIAGKILAVQYARENNIPFFGICLGMQCASIEFARNVCGIENANSREFEEEGKEYEFVIDLMESQKDVKDKGGTMRLGSYLCVLEPNTNAFSAYKSTEISERHRHRYEFNNNYIDLFKSKGIVFSGFSPNKKLVEIIELPTHPWFVGVQFHPELKSRAVVGHPLFIDFIEAVLKK
jgi:CTP synthase